MGVQYLGANPVSDTAGTMTVYSGSPLAPAAWTTAQTTTNSVSVPASSYVTWHTLVLNHYLSCSVNTDQADLELAVSDNAGAYVVLQHCRQLGTGSKTLTLHVRMGAGVSRTYRVQGYRTTGTGTIQATTDGTFNFMQVTTVVVN